MRSYRLLLLAALAVTLTAVGAFADHLQANCPLTYVGSTAPASPFFLSPHGTMRNGSQVFMLSGQTLTTLAITDLGDMKVVREDFISSMANHDEDGGVTYSNGFMFVTGEQGLEIFDLRNVRVGGNAPILISRTSMPHYRRITVDGGTLAAIYPATDLPCQADGTTHCRNQIDLYNITNLTAPTRVASIVADQRFIGWNDIKFAAGYLYATGFGGTWVFDVTTNMSAPKSVTGNGTIGKFLVTNGTSIIGIGQDSLIGVFTISPAPLMRYFMVFTLPTIWDRANRTAFHPEAYIDDNRLITMVDELDPMTLKPARTLGFDAFDFATPFYQNSDDRFYENVSFTSPDEVKYHPILVGPYVHVVGQVSGTQKYGACDQMAGYVTFDFLQAIPCGGAELNGAITSKNKITSVELYLDGTSLGFATLGDERYDVSNAPGPIRSFRAVVNMDNTAQGVHVLRAIGTDMLGNTRQFWAKEVMFNGPGANCTSRKRGLRP